MVIVARGFIGGAHETDGVDAGPRLGFGLGRHPVHGVGGMAWAVLRALLVAELSEAGVRACVGSGFGAGRIRGAAWRPVLHVARHVAALSPKELISFCG